MKKRYTIDESQIAGTFEDLQHELLQDPDFRLEWVEREAALKLARLTHEMREAAGLTQAELAKKMGVAQPVVARMESRKPKRLPRFDTIARFAVACGRRMIINFEREEDLVEPHGHAT